MLHGTQRHRSNKRKNKTCKQKHTYKPFEKKVEDMFREQNIDYESVNYDLTKQLLKDISRANNPDGVSPTDDYYSYINDRWLNNKFDEANYKYLVQYDNFRVVQDTVYKELMTITQSYLDTDVISDTKTNMSNYLKSLKHEIDDKTVTKTVVGYQTEILHLCNDKRNLWKMLALLNDNEIVSWGSPFVWKILPNEQNPTYYTTYIGSGKLTLNDMSLYFPNNDLTIRDKHYIVKYKAFVSDLFSVALGKHHTFNTNDVYECEQKIAQSYVCRTPSSSDNESEYQVITRRESKDKYGFDWDNFMTLLGYKESEIPNSFVCWSKTYFHCMTKLLLKEWNSKAWQTYYVYLYIREIVRFNPKGRDVVFKFNNNFVKGQREPTPQSILNILPLAFAFPNFYNNEYIKKYQDVEAISFVEAMSSDLKEVFIRIIRRNKWLEPKTKVLAIKKLEKFVINVGSKMTTASDISLKYNPTAVWDNIIKVARWRKRRFIELDGSKVQDLLTIDWSSYPPTFVGTQSYIVNAMYIPTRNAIEVPLGYLQKPFIDLGERGLEYNLATIGFTLAHEMSHALDDWGSKYNADGKRETWWSKKDNQHFKRIQMDIIKQYEQFAAYDNIHFDASSSVGEDIADISGLSVCVEYLRDFQLTNKDILPIKKLSFQTFFVYFAFQQRQKVNKKSIQAQVESNPHPLDKYRTNVPLSRLDVFRELYHVKKGDRMWWPSTNKVWFD